MLPAPSENSHTRQKRKTTENQLLFSFINLSYEESRKADCLLNLFHNVRDSSILYMSHEVRKQEASHLSETCMKGYAARRLLFLSISVSLKRK
jgi:hypothetical protein